MFLLKAIRVFLMLKIMSPAISEITVTFSPSTKPMPAKKFRISSRPVIFFITADSPDFINDSGIKIPPRSLFLSNSDDKNSMLAKTNIEFLNTNTGVPVCQCFIYRCRLIVVVSLFTTSAWYFKTGEYRIGVFLRIAGGCRGWKKWEEDIADESAVAGWMQVLNLLLRFRSTQ